MTQSTREQAVEIGSVIRWETPGFDGFGEVVGIIDNVIFLVKIKNGVQKRVTREIVKSVYKKVMP
jgi:hypothetical protein